MALHLVAGDGEMSKKELEATLNDLLTQASDADETFWFIVVGKPEPTTTDTNLMNWVHAQELYFEVLSSDTKGLDAMYKGAQQYHEVKKLAAKAASLMQEKPEDGESADMLALFVSDDPEADEDRWLNDIVQAVADEGCQILALNDGLTVVEMEESEEVEEPEPEPAPAPAKKAAAKKVAAKPATAPAPEEDTDIATDPLTRDQLESMTLPQLKEVAEVRGVSLPPRSRMQTYVNALLGEGEEEAPPQAEVEAVVAPEIEEIEEAAMEEVIEGLIEQGLVEEVSSMNGDMAVFADMVADAVITKLRALLAQ